MVKYKVEIVKTVIKTYRRFVEVEAKDEDAAYKDIDDKINKGLIDLSCNGEDYKYERNLFVSEVKEENKILQNDIKEDFCKWTTRVCQFYYNTDCGHSYSLPPFQNPILISDGEYNICPWCAKRIKYIDETKNNIARKDRVY